VHAPVALDHARRFQHSPLGALLPTLDQLLDRQGSFVLPRHRALVPAIPHRLDLRRLRQGVRCTVNLRAEKRAALRVVILLRSTTLPGLLGGFLWYRPGLLQCRFRISEPCRGLNRQIFSGQSRILLPAKAVLLPSQAGSTPAYHQPCTQHVAGAPPAGRWPVAIGRGRFAVRCFGRSADS
jgi:hypothetical protein